MKLARLFLLLASFSVLASSKAKAGMPSSSRIIVVVNKDAITAADVEERIRLLNLSTNRPVKTPISDEIRKQLTQGMVDEILQLQAAKSKKIEVKKVEVEKALEGLAKENKMSLEAMLKMLKSNGISKQAMVTRLKAQMAWGHYIRAMYGSLVYISDQEVDQQLSKGQEIKVEEPPRDLMDINLCQAIFDINPETPEDAVNLLAPKIEEMQQAKGCKAFLEAARGFGVKVDANRAVKFGQLPDGLKSIVNKAKVGTCMQPVMTPDGLVLTMVCSKSMPKAEPPKPLTRDTAFIVLEQEKLGKRAVQEMAKLRAAACIEWK